MNLAEWTLAQLRAQLPQEPIFDGPRTSRTFDGRLVLPSVRRLIVVHTIAPSHQGVTLVPSKDIARARIIVHTFALSRREIEARRERVLAALKNQTPDDDRYTWASIEHPVSRDEDPDLTLIAEPQLHTLDEFTVAGMEK